MTHGHELRWGIAGGKGGCQLEEGTNWDNYNSIINKLKNLIKIGEYLYRHFNIVDGKYTIFLAYHCNQVNQGLSKWRLDTDLTISGEGNRFLFTGFQARGD